MKEIWKTIKGFEDYQISNLGRVKSLYRVIMRSNNKLHHVKSRILTNRKSQKGYYEVLLYLNKKTISRRFIGWYWKHLFRIRETNLR